LSSHSHATPFPVPQPRPSPQSIEEVQHLTLLPMDAQLHLDFISLDIELWRRVVSYKVRKTGRPNEYEYLSERSTGKVRPIWKTFVTTGDSNFGNMENALEMALILFHFERTGNSLTGYLPELLNELSRLFPSEEAVKTLIGGRCSYLSYRYLGSTKCDSDSDEDSESDGSDEDADGEPTRKSDTTSAEFKRFMRRLVPQRVTHPQLVFASLIS
jgi:hypothetical protein